MGSKRKGKVYAPAHPPIEFNVPPLEALNEAQDVFIGKIADFKRLVFALGPAGTGKTYIATAMAADALRESLTERVIITRPAVEAGESMGFLPGTLEEKFEPYLAPVKDVLIERLGVKKVSEALKWGNIRAVPLNFMRGLTFKNCWVIADEMQNSTRLEMKMLLSRAGDDCKMIVSGDIEQKDIAGMSGLEDGVNRMRGSQYVSIHEFTEADIVRSGLAKDVILRYRK